MFGSDGIRFSRNVSRSSSSIGPASKLSFVRTSKIALLLLRPISGKTIMSDVIILTLPCCESTIRCVRTKSFDLVISVGSTVIGPYGMHCCGASILKRKLNRRSISGQKLNRYLLNLVCKWEIRRSLQTKVRISKHL